MTHSSAGNGSLRNLLLSALFLIVLAAVGWAWTSTALRISDTEKVLVRHGEQLAAQEAEHQLFKVWLGRVEQKLDSVLERRGVGSPTR